MNRRRFLMNVAGLAVLPIGTKVAAGTVSNWKIGPFPPASRWEARRMRLPKEKVTEMYGLPANFFEPIPGLKEAVKAAEDELRLAEERRYLMPIK